MKITWLGHSCFALEQEEYCIVVDPYKDVEGYPPLEATAHAVFCSHEHGDHNCREAVALLPERESPFTVREVETFHDEVQGAERGRNLVRIFSAGGIRVCHLGDLGHLLSPEQIREIGPCDVLLVPIGGTYTVSGAQAAEIVRAVGARCAVPMHYAHPPYGLPVLEGAEGFLSCFDPAEITHIQENSFAVTAELPRILVPAFKAP